MTDEPLKASSLRLDLTHEQQVRVIEGNENTKNAEESFDAALGLKRSEAVHEAKWRMHQVPQSPMQARLRALAIL